MLQHTPLCTRGRRNFCARVPAAPDRAADHGAVRNAQDIHNAVKAVLRSSLRLAEGAGGGGFVFFEAPDK